MSAPTQEEINRIVAGYNRANEAPDYVDTLKLTAQQISEDEYRMIWSTLYTGNFVPDALQE